MATANSTSNDAGYVAGNQLSDAAMFIQSAMRLIQKTDGGAYCLLDKALAEIVSAQDYLESMDPIESPIDESISAMLGRIGLNH